MSDKPPMPPQPTTKEIPAMTDRALLEDLRAVVKAGFSEMRADIQLVSTDVQVVKDRVVILEKWKLENEERVSRHSAGTRQLSDSDAKQDRALAETLVKVRALETSQADQTAKLAVIEKKNDYQTVLLTEAKDAATKLWRHPAVRLLAGAIWGWVLYELGKRGIDVPK